MSDSAKKNILEWIYCIVIAIVLALLIKFFIGTPTVVKQHSMYPTYKPNDRLILNRMARAKMPKRGEVVTFEAPSKSVYGPGEYDLNNLSEEDKEFLIDYLSEEIAGQHF